MGADTSRIVRRALSSPVVIPLSLGVTAVWGTERWVQVAASSALAGLLGVSYLAAEERDTRETVPVDELRSEVMEHVAMMEFSSRLLNTLNEALDVIPDRGDRLMIHNRMIDAISVVKEQHGGMVDP